MNEVVGEVTRKTIELVDRLVTIKSVALENYRENQNPSGEQFEANFLNLI